MTRGAALAVAAVVCGLAVGAAGKQFTSPKGFSFSYPDDWQVLTKEEQARSTGETASAPDPLGKVDLTQIEVVVYQPQERFSSNATVAVLPGRARLGEKGQQEAVAQIRKQYTDRGLRVASIRPTQAKVGDVDALSLAVLLALDDGGMTQQRVMIVPSRGHTILLCCSCSVDDAARTQPAFDQIVGSLKVEGGAGSFWTSLPPAGRYAIIGAAIGLGVAALARMKRRSRDANAEPPGLSGSV